MILAIIFVILLSIGALKLVFRISSWILRGILSCFWLFCLVAFLIWII